MEKWCNNYDTDDIFYVRYGKMKKLGNASAHCCG